MVLVATQRCFCCVLGAAWILGKFVLHYIVLNLHIDLYIYI